MKKTWKPQVAGILSIVGGVIGLFGSLGIMIAIAAIDGSQHWINDFNGYWDVGNVIPILWAIGIPIFVCSVLSIVGGIFAIQRKVFGLALTGAITAFIPVWIFGLLSVIFLALSHDEFNPENKTVVTGEKAA